MKQIKLTEKNAKKYPVLYLIMFNEYGLHDKVYKLKLSKYGAAPCWIDGENGISFCIPIPKREFGEIIKPKRTLVLGWNVSPRGSGDFLTTDKAEAEFALKAIQLYREHVKRLLSL